MNEQSDQLRTILTALCLGLDDARITVSDIEFSGNRNVILDHIHRAGIQIHKAIEELTNE